MSTAGRSVLRNARDGLGYIWKTKAVRVIGLGFFAVVAFSGVDDVAMVFLAKDELRAGDSAAAVLVRGSGDRAGGWVCAADQVCEHGDDAAVVDGWVCGDEFGESVHRAGLGGVGGACAADDSGAGDRRAGRGDQYAFAARGAGDMLGRVFGNLYGAIGLAAGISYVFGGLLLEHTDARVTFIAAWLRRGWWLVRRGRYCSGV